MKQRQFLINLNIWGAMLVSQGADVLHYSIPCLLNLCDHVLLMCDNLSEESRVIIEKYKNKYPDKIHVAETGFPVIKEGQNYLRRFKNLQGPCREKVFEYLRKVHAEKKIDLFIFPDEDEIFGDFFPELLELFWKTKDKRAITIKPIDVFVDMQTITGRSMTGHTRIMKFFPELTGNAYRTGCCYRPLTRHDRMGCKFYTIHLCHLKTKRFDWRVKNWKKGPRLNWGLWKLLKDIRRMHPKEIKEVLARPPDFTVEEYLRGGEKRIPVGIENSKKALKEATDILDQLGVRYFLAFGTALGLYRDKTLISWDWDLDLIILGEDNEKLEQGKQKILEAGFTDFKRKQDIPKWIKPDGTKSEEKYVRTYSFHKYGARIDLDPAYLSADGQSRIILKGRKREMFCGKHPAKWFDDHGGVEYDGKFYRMPTPIEDYLVSNYGSGWKTPVYSLTRWQKRPCFSQYYECR